MLDIIKELLAPHYIYIKFIHLLFVMIWAWSTSVAYVWYVRIAWREWATEPDNPHLRARRDWVYEQFDKGVLLEHIAFPIILLTGPLLLWLGNWDMAQPWLAWKLLIVVALFIPIEIFDYWIAHFGGNKLRHKSDAERHEHLMQLHHRFLVLISPVIVSSVLAVLFLAIVKPTL